MRTGELKETNLYDATLNKGNQLTLLNTYTWDNGLNWKINLKYDHALGSYVYQTPMAMEQKDASAGYYLKAVDGTLKPYEGYVQSRMSCLNQEKSMSFSLPPNSPVPIVIRPGESE